jgi:hypothetical protein
LVFKILILFIFKKPLLTIFTLLVLSEMYLPSYKTNFFLQLLFLVILLTVKKVKITVSFFKQIVPLILIFGIGFLGMFINSYPLSFIFKDLTYFLKPIICLAIGYIVFYKNEDLDIFVRNIFYIGLLSAIIHLVGVLFFSNFLQSSISDIRGDYGLDSFIEIFAFYFLFYSKKWFGKRLIVNKTSYWICIVVFLLSIFFYFSRTMLIVFFLGYFTLQGYTKITKNSLKYIGIIFLAILLFYTYLFSVKIERNSNGIEAFLYKIKNAPEEIFKTKINRENHKDLWDHWRAYEAKRAIALMNDHKESYIIGSGYGSLVNLKFKAPIGDEDMKYISRLHNGYVFVFYKIGLFGILLLLYFLLKLYLKAYLSKQDELHLFYINRFVSFIGIFYLFTSLIITGIYIPKDTIIFVLGGFLTYQEKLKFI